MLLAEFTMLADKQTKPVPIGVIWECLEIAVQAPTSANVQNWSFIVVTRRRVRVNDLWIAAIAASKHRPVVTHDDDFEPLVGVADLTIIRV
jgi:nitroreductase